jgi:hypothetical protein
MFGTRAFSNSIVPNFEAQAATNGTITSLWEFSETEIAKRE